MFVSRCLKIKTSVLYETRKNPLTIVSHWKRFRTHLLDGAEWHLAVRLGSSSLFSGQTSFPSFPGTSGMGSPVGVCSVQERIGHIHAANVAWRRRFQEKRDHTKSFTRRVCRGSPKHPDVLLLLVLLPFICSHLQDLTSSSHKIFKWSEQVWFSPMCFMIVYNQLIPFSPMCFMIVYNQLIPFRVSLCMCRRNVTSIKMSNFHLTEMCQLSF